MVAALVAIAALGVQTPSWQPLRVEYELRPDESGAPFDVRRFSWSFDGDRWSLLLPQQASDTPLILEGPGGRAPVEPDGLVFDTTNPGLAMEGPDWDQRWGTGLRDPHLHYLLEVWENTSWRVFRLIWPIGGVSGPPPVPLVTIAKDRATGRWAALATSFDENVPDGGDTHGLEVQADRTLMTWCWQWHTQSVLARRSWSVRATPAGVRWRRGPTTYMLNTENGIPTTYASDPRDAVHWGYQEVAWHVASATVAGGEAVAFGESPRRIECSDDASDGLVTPGAGIKVTFKWPKSVYIIPYRAKGHWAPTSDALSLVLRGGWDVVLFRHDKGRIFAERLVQHQRDFAHSTPQSPEIAPAPTPRPQQSVSAIRAR